MIENKAADIARMEGDCMFSISHEKEKKTRIRKGFNVLMCVCKSPAYQQLVVGRLPGGQAEELQQLLVHGVMCVVWTKQNKTRKQFE